MPTLWLGNRVLRILDLNVLTHARAEDLGPAWSSAHGPTHAIGYPEQRLVGSPPVLEHEAWLPMPLPMDRALVVNVILAAFNNETVDRSQLQRSDDVGEASAARLELSDAVATPTDHDHRLDRQLGERLQQNLSA